MHTTHTHTHTDTHTQTHTYTHRHTHTHTHTATHTQTHTHDLLPHSPHSYHTHTTHTYSCMAILVRVSIDQFKGLLDVYKHMMGLGGCGQCDVLGSHVDWCSSFYSNRWGGGMKRECSRFVIETRHLFVVLMCGHPHSCTLTHPHMLTHLHTYTSTHLHICVSVHVWMCKCAGVCAFQFGMAASYQHR